MLPFFTLLACALCFFCSAWALRVSFDSFRHTDASNSHDDAWRQSQESYFQQVLDKKWLKHHHHHHHHGHSHDHDHDHDDYHGGDEPSNLCEEGSWRDRALKLVHEIPVAGARSRKLFAGMFVQDLSIRGPPTALTTRCKNLQHMRSTVPCPRTQRYAVSYRQQLLMNLSTSLLRACLHVESPGNRDCAPAPQYPVNRNSAVYTSHILFTSILFESCMIRNPQPHANLS
jgi:hypothetical protein